VQQEAEVAPTITFILQDSCDILVSVTGMDRKWHSCKSCGAYVGAEPSLLYVTRRAIVEVIQPGFSNPYDLGMPGQSGDGLGFRHRFLGRVMRMDPHRAPEVRMRLGDRRQTLRLR
jgi:hypothetical protein